MIKHKNTLLAMTSAVMALVLGAVALFTPQAVYAQSLAHSGPGGRGGFMGGFGESDTYLAQALGITADELTAAKDAAWTKIVNQAVADGLITEAQATTLKEDGYSFHGRGRGLESWLINEANVDYEAALAAELGLTTDQLDAKRAEARDLQIQAAVDAGEITADEADQMRARMALRTYIDRETMLANALGITVEDLQTARQNGTSLSDLITSSGKTQDEVASALKLAVEEAVAQAVADGKITQAQADAYLGNSDVYSLDRFYGGRGMKDRGMDGMKGLFGLIDPQATLADALGMTTDELQTAFQDGKTLSELITASGKTEADVTAAVKEALSAALQQAVTDGTITQTQADQILADFSLNSFFGGRGKFGPGEFNSDRSGDGMFDGRHGRGGEFTPPTDSSDSSDSNG